MARLLLRLLAAALVAAAGGERAVGENGDVHMVWLRFIEPQPGMMVASCNVHVGVSVTGYHSAESFLEQYPDVLVAFALDGEAWSTFPLFDEESYDPLTEALCTLPPGAYVLDAWLVDARGAVLSSHNATVAVRQPTHAEIEAAARSAGADGDAHVASWLAAVTQRRGTRPPAAALPEAAPCGELMLVGVKSTPDAAGAEARAAVRATWLRGALPGDVTAVFLVGRPTAAQLPALLQEQGDFGDLVATGAAVAERFGDGGLARVVGLLAASQPCTASFVVVTDDHSHAQLRGRLHEGLLRHRESDLWLGGRLERDARVSSSSVVGAGAGAHTAASREAYPLREFPPRPRASFYVLGRALRDFVARNWPRLNAVDGNEGAAVALWALALGVEAEDMMWFQSARQDECSAGALVTTDLSVRGQVGMQGNLDGRQPVCRGFGEEWRW